MKRVIVIIVCLFSTFLGMNAQSDVVERTYVTTDRDVYLAGEPVRCSAFTMDIAGGVKPSGLSSTLYLELHSAERMAATAKIALIGGRGAGQILLPNNLPTGNYKIVAYTAINKDEVDYQYDNKWSKTISVFNTFSNERVKDGVKVVDAQDYTLSDKGYSTYGSGIELKKYSEENGKISLSVKNTTESDASISVSVFHNNGLRSYNQASVRDFFDALLQKGNIELRHSVIPDYEGEIIYGKCIGADAGGLGDIRNTYALISVPGEGSDCYLSAISEDGSVKFFTGNIYGDKEMVCEIAGLDSLSASHIELASPFVDAATGDIAALEISESLSDVLSDLSLAMQIEQSFAADTLYEYLTQRPTTLFRDNAKTYVLDDYTRLPTMEEVIVEFVKELRFHKVNGKTDIQLLMEDRHGDSYHSEEPPLLMLDGVPVQNHGKIISYDPLLVEKIEIYPHIYCIGGKEFMGVVNFTTYKRNLPSMNFDNNVRIVNYQGVSVPTAYTGASISGSDSYPDYRQTIYWHPIVNVKAGESFEFDCVLPDYKGDFTVVIEGLTNNGASVYYRSSL